MSENIKALMTIIDEGSYPITNLNDLKDRYGLIRAIGIIAEVCEWEQTGGADGQTYITSDVETLRKVFNQFIMEHCSTGVEFRGWKDGSTLTPVFEMQGTQIVCTFKECHQLSSMYDSIVISNNKTCTVTLSEQTVDISAFFAKKPSKINVSW